MTSTEGHVDLCAFVVSAVVFFLISFDCGSTSKVFKENKLKLAAASDGM